MSDPNALRISWSRVRNHDECPAKGDLLRRHKSPYTNIRDFFHGNVVDLAMRRWLSQENPEPGWMLAQVDALFEESEQIAKDTKDGIIRWRDSAGQDKAETREFCRQLVTQLEPILVKYALPFEWTPAVRFSVPIEVTDLHGHPREIILIGEMDLLVRDCEGRYAVWDLKATRNDRYYEKVLGQLAFYSIAVAAMHGQFPAVTGLIQPMCKQQVLPVTVDEQAVREMAGRIERVVRDILAGKLAPKADNDGCTGPYGCPVQHACPKFARKPGRVSLRTAAA